MIDEFVPIVLFVVIGTAYWLFLFYQNRTRTETQKTIRLLIERGGDLSPDFIERLANPESATTRDLRRTAIWLSLSAGLVLCGFAVPDPSGSVLRGCLAGAAFPFSIGIAYLIMWQYGLRKEST